MDDIPRFVVGTIQQRKRGNGHKQRGVPAVMSEIPHLSAAERRCAAAFCLDDEQAPFEALREQPHVWGKEGL